MPNCPAVDESLDHLHRAGWSVGDTAFGPDHAIVWCVSGGNGENLVEAQLPWRMGDRVILTPHVAGYSPRIAGRHLAVLLDNVGRFVRGKPLTNVVDKARWF